MFRGQSIRTTGQKGEVVRRHRPDYQIVLFTSLLILIGIVVLVAIGPARVELMNAMGESDLDAGHFMQRQFMYVGIGIAAFLVASKLPLSLWQKVSSWWLLGGLGLCVALALFGLVGLPIALEAGGAYRWFNLGFIGFQPAEVLKFGMLLFIAVFLGRKIRQGKVNDVQGTLVPLAVLLGIAMFFIILLQKDMGTGITMTGIVAAQLFMAGLSKKYLAYGGAALLFVGVMLIVIAPHRMERVMTLFVPHEVGSAETHHIDQAAIAIGSGGVLGKGLGQSVQAFGYVPEALNDSIFAILGETFGLIGLIVIMSLFFALLLRLLKISDHLSDPALRLLVAGVFGWLATHVVVNIGSMIGVFPLTGVTLPLISFGGTSMVFVMLALGLAFQASRYTSHEFADNQAVDNARNTQKGARRSEGTYGRRGVRRPRHASARGY